ncbi:hypothetical protein BC952_2441 [Flavobacterium limicola]|uniref:Uncharacterized protein n=1 Tax=Flavobacterium limicola TaxID=180441 RepID=A0A495S048_9FLAO|nr:hypothetical protein BC952_2441 [Flavobacterium limicola]
MKYVGDFTSILIGLALGLIGEVAPFLLYLF